MSKPVCWLAVVVAVIVAGTGCSSSSTPQTNQTPSTPTTSTTTDASTVTESGDGGEGKGAPGDLLESAEIDVEGVDALKVRYLSTGVNGELVEVTGMVLSPQGGVGPEPQVISWAHGTTGIGDTCAPSARPDSVSPAPVALAQAGYVVAITDYEGLGTEGTHPYLVGESEGRSVIDIVRAVASLEFGVGERYGVAGLSQGGHAALWAGQIAPSYAPELDLVGVVAAAPAANIKNLMQTIGTPIQGFAVMSAVALDSVYDDVSLVDYFTPEAISAMDVVHQGCNIEVFAAFVGFDTDEMVLPEAWDRRQPIGALADRLVENEVGQASIDAPVLLVQGDEDAIVARQYVETVHSDYCALNTNAEYRLYVGGGHSDTVMTAMDEVVGWFADRFANKMAPDGCSIVDPDLEALRDAGVTPAIDGTLLDGQTPGQYQTLTGESNNPPTEICPGTPIYGGLPPVAFSQSAWVVDDGIGPFLDVSVTQFESPTQAAAAMAAVDRELVDCGTFTDQATTAQGSFTRAEAPGIGDESVAHTYAGTVSGFGVNRVMLTVRVGDTLYSASQTAAFVGADRGVAVEAIEAMLGSD